MQSQLKFIFLDPFLLCGWVRHYIHQRMMAKMNCKGFY